MKNLAARDMALLRVGRWLREQRYEFVTISPASHARVNERAAGAPARSLRDVFGWSRAFRAGLLDAQVLRWLADGDWLESAGDGLLRSKVRFSSLGENLYVHSAYPTSDPAAVFFGPDTYRFAALIGAQLRADAPRGEAMRILDVGCGGGPGGIVAAQSASPPATQLVLADISAKALRFAAVNAALANVEPAAQLVESDLFAAVPGQFDLIVANPPYLNDPAHRIYRDGGGKWGASLSERIVREGLAHLAPGGLLLLYTGAAIIEGADPLLQSLGPELAQSGCEWTYRELDPDVFGEELERGPYAMADRIAAVALTVRRAA